MEIMNSSWKDRLKVNYTYNTIGSGKDLISFIEKLLEEAIKETEQNTAKEIFDEIEQCEFVDMGTWYEISIKNFEQLREKYKGVEL
jgi:hypothetical protein